MASVEAPGPSWREAASWGVYWAVADGLPRLAVRAAARSAVSPEGGYRFRLRSCGHSSAMA